MASITIEELRSFHSIDRELFSRLILNMGRDPYQSMQLIALWICLGQVGYPNIILKMLSLADSLVNMIADEGVEMLKCIASEMPPLVSPRIMVIPLTKKLMEDIHISLESLNENRTVALTDGIMRTVNEVCFKAFEDILLQAMGSAEAVAQLTARHMPAFGESSLSNRSSVNPVVSMPQTTNNDSQRQRTLFITYSRGYHVTEKEIRDFFVMWYGDCVEAIHMQDVPPNEQPIYAHLLLHSSSMIPVILDGKDRARIEVNGKHLRIRRLEAK